jgi:carbamoyl-phosphate synthase large subunit
VSSVNDALKAAEAIGYPVILRAAYTLGGLGSGFADNPDELRDLSAKGLSLSPQLLIERSMKGWKELEYEVVRDGADVCI